MVGDGLNTDRKRHHSIGDILSDTIEKYWLDYKYTKYGKAELDKPKISCIKNVHSGKTVYTTTSILSIIVVVLPWNNSSVKKLQVLMIWKQGIFKSYTTLVFK